MAHVRFLDLAPRLGPPVFLPPRKPTFQITIRPGISGHLVECPLLNPTFINIIIIIFIIIIIIIISLLSLLLIRHAHLFPILKAYVSFWWYRLML